MSSVEYLSLNHFERATLLAKSTPLDDSQNPEMALVPIIKGRFDASRFTRPVYARDDRNVQVLNKHQAKHGGEPGRDTTTHRLLVTGVKSFALTVNESPNEWLRKAQQGLGAPKHDEPKIGMGLFPVVNEMAPSDGTIPPDTQSVVRKFGSGMNVFVTPEPLADWQDGVAKDLPYYEVEVKYGSQESPKTAVHYFDARIECVKDVVDRYNFGNEILGVDQEDMTFRRMVTSAILLAPNRFTTIHHPKEFISINPSQVYGDSFLMSHALACLQLPVDQIVTGSLFWLPTGICTPWAVRRIREKALIARHVYQQTLLCSASPVTRAAANRVMIMKAPKAGDPEVMVEAPTMMYMDVNTLGFLNPVAQPHSLVYDSVAGVMMALQAIYSGFGDQARTPEERAAAEKLAAERAAASKYKRSLALNPNYMDAATKKAIEDGDLDLTEVQAERKQIPVEVEVIAYDNFRPRLDSKGQVMRVPVEIPLMNIAQTFQDDPRIAPYVFAAGDPDNLSGETMVTQKPQKPVPSEKNKAVYDELYAKYLSKKNKYNSLNAGLTLNKLESYADAGEHLRLKAIYKKALASYNDDHATRMTKSTGFTVGSRGKKIKNWNNSSALFDVFGAFTEDDDEPRPAPKRAPAASTKEPPAKKGKGRPKGPKK